MIASRQPRFSMGRIVATPGALAALDDASQDSGIFFALHLSCDWGECDADDQQANDNALDQGGRLFSIYSTSKDVQIWVITEADRSSTCMMLPDDY